MWIKSLLNSHSQSWNPIDRIVFPAPTPTYNVDSFPDELIFIPRDDGEKVPCLFLPFKHARFIIIHFHANGDDIGAARPFCNALREVFLVHVLCVEYPGYGVCHGVPDEDGILANAFAAMTFVTETLGWPGDGIMLFGRSLGTGPAVALAVKYELAGVILIAPFLSIRELFRNQVGRLADVVIDRFQNVAQCVNITSPTLIIHGKQDGIVPCEHGRRIFESLTCRKMMVCPQLMTHNSCLMRNVADFVLPMTQFFAIPDYTFEEIQLPDWVRIKDRPIEKDTNMGTYPLFNGLHCLGMCGKTDSSKNISERIQCFPLQASQKDNNANADPIKEPVKATATLLQTGGALVDENSSGKQVSTENEGSVQNEHEKQVVQI